MLNRDVPRSMTLRLPRLPDLLILRATRGLPAVAHGQYLAHLPLVSSTSCFTGH
jgi:hypothetical protein